MPDAGGEFFDVKFDGQSSITMRSSQEPDLCYNFVGNDGFHHTVSGKAMKGTMLAVSSWVADDPIKATLGMSVAERRAALAQIGKQLLPGGVRANHYPETAIWADVDVPAL